MINLIWTHSFKDSSYAVYAYLMQAPWRCCMRRPQLYVSVYTYMSIYKFVHVYINWCCFCYPTRNNLVALAKCRVRVGQIFVQTAPIPWSYPKCTSTHQFWSHRRQTQDVSSYPQAQIHPQILQLIRMLSPKKKICFRKLTKSHHDFLGKIRGATPRNSALLGCALHTQPSWCWMSDRSGSGPP